MYTALSPGAIGVRRGDLEHAIDAARRHGFGGVEVDAREIADLAEKRGDAGVLDRFRSAGVRPAGWGLPVDWRGAEEAWRQDVDNLPRLARHAAALGCTRCMTWIMPCSDDLAFEDNLRFHAARFRPIAAVLAEHGCRLGLEFIGPATLWKSRRHAFVHTMEGMLELAAAVGSNVGLLLDCWHWYTSHGSQADIAELRAEQVVYVHVNDAPRGVAVDEQIDNVRALPGATGVIDITGFLQALDSIGYDGPVTPEPFSADLTEMPTDEERLTAVSTSMRAIFAAAGVNAER